MPDPAKLHSDYLGLRLTENDGRVNIEITRGGAQGVAVELAVDELRFIAEEAGKILEWLDGLES